MHNSILRKPTTILRLVTADMDDDDRKAYVSTGDYKFGEAAEAFALDSRLLAIAEEDLLRLIAGSTALTAEQKCRILFRIEQDTLLAENLFVALFDERAALQSLAPKHWPQLKKLERKSLAEWAGISAAFCLRLPPE